MYDGLFSTDDGVTLAYSGLEGYSEPSQIIFRTMCKPSIFKTLAYSESKAYSEYC